MVASEGTSTRSSSEQKRYLTLKEGAAILQVSVQFLYDRIDQPHGPPFQRIGRWIRLPREEFMKYASQKVIP